MSGQSDAGRRSAARGSPRRMATSTATEGEEEGRPNTTRRLVTEEQDFINESLSAEERFVSGTSLPASSWESQSFDSEEPSRSSRPSSRTSLRDRRKRFDTTTPTLIDEEDIPGEEEEEEEEEEEMVSLERAGLEGFDSKEYPSLRRTPGAAMYRSALDTADAESASLRRTPGATAMHQSAGPDSDIDREKKSALGFGLTLTTPVAGEELKEGKPRMWESYAPSGTTSPIPGQRSSETDQPAKPPLAPAPAATARPQDSRAAASSFSLQPWTREKSPTASLLSPGRQGAFSPRLLRLTEDIGNLLQEDEDDDYAIEVPSVFRGDKEDSSESGADWTGALGFESNSAFARKSIPHQAKEGKSRRRSGSNQGKFLPNAQQPKPRRSGNEVFEFGKARADERASPQLFNFGGAFAPPAKDTVGSFTKPLEPAGPPQDPSLAFLDQAAQGIDYAGLHEAQAVQTAHSFDSYQSSNPRASPMDPYFQPYRFASPSPTNMTRVASPYGAQQSDIQATAREFVPMSTRGSTGTGSSTPQFPAAGVAAQQWTQPTQSPYDASLEQGSWHTSSGYSYGTSYGYGMQSPSFVDARSSMTPSPLAPVWQPGEPSTYRGTAHSHAEGMNPPYVPTSLSKHHTGVVGGPGPSERVKRETRRGKRGKKKSKKSENFTGSASKKPTPTGQKKKLQRQRSGSTTQSHDGQGEETGSAWEDPVDSRRAELDESPAVRQAFKDFYKQYRSEERLGVQRAEEFAMRALEEGSVPESVHWRVYVELADLARRTNRFVEARRLYQKVCQLQPYASQGWVEYSKLEEECGNMNRVANILHAGLEYCEYSENILIRAVKHQERMGNLVQARSLLARLKHVGIEKVWRSILEGAMFEARQGNIVMARRVLKYIMHKVPWYGPLYIEFYRLERDHGHPLDALEVVERGLAKIPRYGPLWFSALRVCEQLDISKGHFHLPKTTEILQRANESVSKEIAWKLHLEASFVFERAALEQAHQNSTSADPLMSPARHCFAMTIQACPLNLRWKVWLAAARMELCVGNTDRARALFLRAHQVSPEKTRSLTFLDYARMEEYVGDTDLARAILCKGRVEYGHDWKIWLESVLLEMRAFSLTRALELASNALEVHPGTGRLWAALVQLSQYTGGDEAQYSVLRKALNAVPKSGEVWCEGARIHLNPFSDVFDLDRARRHLSFAGRFTPQYGDSFLETVRLEMLRQWLAPLAEYIWEQTKSSFLAEKCPEDDCLTKYITDVSLAISLACRSESETVDQPKVVHRHIISTVRRRLEAEAFRKVIDLTSLRLSCTNADPNYGPLWFHCRRIQTDRPGRVIECAAVSIAEDLRKHAHVYLAAMIRRSAILSTMESEMPPLPDDAVEIFDPVVIAWEERIDGLLRSSPSLHAIYNPVDPTTGLVLLGSTINGSDFVTGLMELNRYRPLERLSLLDRRRAIFATDALFP